MKFHSIEEAVKDIELGKMIIVVDDEDRENEGDLIMAAEKITPEAINFMATHAKGLICTPITKERADELELPLMVKKNDALYNTAFTISIDSVYGGTGISAEDRYRTVLALTNDETRADELSRPGHIFPLIARDGGVLKRAGHTEAAVDLARLANLKEAGVICEIINDDGTMSRRDDLFRFAEKFDLKIITIKDLIEYRRQRECLVRETSRIDFPNDHGNFELAMFESMVNDEHHVALVKGDISNGEPVLVRVHSECFTGDIFGSKRCDCGDQLNRAMQMIEEEGRGVVLYMRQEGRGIGLPNKIRAYKLQDSGLDTVDANKTLGFKADLREYGIGAQILKALGIQKMRLMTNNPKKIIGLEAFDLEITERVSIEIEPNEVNNGYLTTKRDRMGHMILDQVH